METHVMLLDVSLPGFHEREKEEFLEKLLPSLSGYRQEKVRRTRFLEDKLCSAGAGLLYQQGLQKFGLDGKTETIVFCGSGKPYLREHPEICFNLSHSGSLALAVFAGSETGCDIEKDKKPDYRIAGRFFHEEERAELESQTDEQKKADLFFRYWTLKESYLKVTGEGMRLGMNNFCMKCLREPEEICGSGGAADPIRVRFNEKSREASCIPEPTAAVCVNGGKKPYDFLEWRLPGYHAALCTAKDPGRVFFSFQNLQDVV